MKFEINISEIDLNTVVGDVVSFDEWGDAVVEGQTRVADLVADRIADRVTRNEEYRELKKRVTAIRDEMIREKLQPILDELMQAPIRKTNWMGEPEGDPVTMRELIIEASRDLLTKGDANGRSRSPWITSHIMDQVRILFQQELKADLDAARAALKKEILGRVASDAAATVDEALKGKI